jgi:hypothetical protein
MLRLVLGHLDPEQAELEAAYPDIRNSIPGEGQVGRRRK